MSSKNRVVISFMVFILVMSLFIFTAAIEYNRSYQNHIKETQDTFRYVKINLENVITSRMAAIKGLNAYIEINPDFNQNEFNYFAKGIYESSSDVVQSMSFLTDTKITHIYPFDDYKSIIGVDLSLNEEQKAWIDYAKSNQKAIITAPVNLVEGGVGIVVRIPVERNNNYFGQVSIVFDSDKTLKSSGLIELADHYYVELSKIDELSKLERVIWTNKVTDDTFSDNNMIFHHVNLYDATMIVKAVPKSGFDGKSVLFYLILLIGWLIALVSCFMAYKLLAITVNLSHSEKALKENNEELGVMVNQLNAQNKEIHQQKEYIEFLADSDYLTNLFNRRKFTKDIMHHIKLEESGTILLLDIDNFKNINDTQGHHYGDKVLQHMSCIMTEVLSKNTTVYRIGGDEFAIHLSGICDNEKIEAHIALLFDALIENNYIEKIKNRITVSIGIAKYPLDSSNVDDLLIKSDIAMYQAKNQGKNRFCYFTENLISDFDYNVKIERELQNALELDKFKLLYQPIIDSRTGHVSSFEALLRIEDSLLSPLQFIAVAENSGLIIAIGHQVIDQVCRQLRNWKANHGAIKPVAINISAKQLYDGKIVDYLKDTLAKYDIAPNLIEIEITESVLIENSDFNIALLSELRHFGFKISLDDFGTGYSSLSYLAYMPVDKVKIDKSLKDRFLFLEDHSIMEGIISICHGLKLQVVTEGVESKEDYQRLRAFGSDFLQGFYFQKPIEPEKAIKLLDQKYFT